MMNFYKKGTVDEKKIQYDNRPEIFGHQQVMDEEDNLIREEKCLLLNETASIIIAERISAATKRAILRDIKNHLSLLNII